MDMNVYQLRAAATRLKTADATYCQLNLAGEVGELLGYIAKCRRKGVEPDPEVIAKEGGDVLWQLSQVLADYGLYLDDVAELNLEKLSDRQARGVLDGSGDNR